eukprot:TRINITY_DN27988_c0_g1_i1.p1 TRINITY_DN27988_c0_g1~~TRINITY_DN27988_c0_g1_i1.p1  ORF type:complete len:308 (-),score=34.54 TRINITY_DN27988_c0_g1_i1:51-896(-)
MADDQPFAGGGSKPWAEGSYGGGGSSWGQQKSWGSGGGGSWGSSWGSSWNSSSWESRGPARTPATGVQQQCVGILIEWQNKGFNSFGWILPIHGIDNVEAAAHGGDVYVHNSDIQDPRLGSIVTFSVYQDQHGLGAQDCRPRQVIRFIVPTRSADIVNLPEKEVNHASSYLQSSVFYPELEEKGVTLRRYVWEEGLRVFEMWGNPQAIAAAADELSLLTHPEAQVLLSPHMARQQKPDCVRLISEADLPHVPRKCRISMSLKTGQNGLHPRDRLVELLDVL